MKEKRQLPAKAGAAISQKKRRKGTFQTWLPTFSKVALLFVEFSIIHRLGKQLTVSVLIASILPDVK